MRSVRGVVATLLVAWTLAVAALASPGPVRAAPGTGVVYLIPATGIVDDVLADWIAGGIALAAREGASAVIVKLDTPGGALAATSRITGALLEAPIPTIVWVAPQGGRAASAGTFITLAGAVALMAEGTNIGAASPVGAGGEEIEGTLGRKVRNDAIANITAIAEARGRNVAWAVSTVERAAASPASEAVRVGAVDGTANTIEEVLAAASGRDISTSRGIVRIEPGTPLEVRTLELGPVQSFLHALSDPNVAFVLFVVGLLGLGIELFNPNLVTGMAGAFGILLAFIGFGSLPLNVAGLLLVVLGVALLVAETAIVSHGLLGAAGIAALVLGGSALYGSPGSPTGPAVAVALPVLATMALLGGAAAVGIAVVGIRTRRIRGAAGTVGEESLVGEQGEVRVPLAPAGTVYAGGEEWTARSADGRGLPRGTAVRVLRRDGLTLVVEPVSGSATDAPAGP